MWAAAPRIQAAVIGLAAPSPGGQSRCIRISPARSFGCSTSPPSGRTAATTCGSSQPSSDLGNTVIGVKHNEEGIVRMPTIFVAGSTVRRTMG